MLKYKTIQILFLIFFLSLSKESICQNKKNSNSVSFIYVHGPNNCTCKYCGRQFKSSKRGEGIIEFEKSMSSVTMSTSIENYEKWKSNPKLTQFITPELTKTYNEYKSGKYTITLYECGEFCSVKCKDECAKSINCH